MLWWERAPCAARGAAMAESLEAGVQLVAGSGSGMVLHGGATGLLGDRTELHVVRGRDGDERAEDGHDAEDGHEQPALAELDHDLLILASKLR